MKQPNILFLYPDQHRGDWMLCPETVSRAMGMDPLPFVVCGLVTSGLKE